MATAEGGDEMGGGADPGGGADATGAADSSPPQASRPAAVEPLSVSMVMRHSAASAARRSAWLSGMGLPMSASLLLYKGSLHLLLETEGRMTGSTDPNDAGMEACRMSDAAPPGVGRFRQCRVHARRFWAVSPDPFDLLLRDASNMAARFMPVLPPAPPSAPARARCTRPHSSGKPGAHGRPPDRCGRTRWHRAAFRHA